MVLGFEPCQSLQGGLFPFEKLRRFYGLEDVNRAAVLPTRVAVVRLSVPQGSLGESGIVQVR